MSTITTLFAPAKATHKPDACPHCGVTPPPLNALSAEDMQRRIAELETQVYIMTSKATAAADRLADYEDELRRLKSPPGPLSPDESAPAVPSSTTTPTPDAPSNPDHDARPPSSKGAHPPTQLSDRLTSLLGSRKPSPTNGPPRTPRECDLEAALAREQALRRQAEGQLTDVNGELEDLSAQLFQQANEMVAAERKARARLEERVEVLEKRDGDKRKRLERLESAVKRIDRVKGLLSVG